MLTNEDLNYAAIIVQVDKLIDLPGLDNLVGFPAFGAQAIVSKTTEVGDIGVLFLSETQLSGDFCKKNNLYRKAEWNEDITKTGYICEKNRVRAVKLKSNMSTALFMPITSLDYLGYKFKVGDTFTHVNGHFVCKKYIIKVPEKRDPTTKVRKQRKSRIEPHLFPTHTDTESYFRNNHLFNDGDYVTVTQKLHGCLKEDTLLETNLGLKTIKEIVDNKLEVSVRSCDVSTGIVQYSQVTDFFTKEDNDDWYEIITEDNKKLTITGDHLVWLPTLKCYRKVKDLKESDILLS